MTTQQIQYIIAITEEGSFSAAAKKLVVTQPSISQLVKNTRSALPCSTEQRSRSN